MSKCYPIHIENASYINIKKCNFMDNISHFANGSCLQLEVINALFVYFK